MAPGRGTYGSVWSAAFQRCKKRAKILKWRLKPLAELDSRSGRDYDSRFCYLVHVFHRVFTKNNYIMKPLSVGSRRYEENNNLTFLALLMRFIHPPKY